MVVKGILTISLSLFFFLIFFADLKVSCSKAVKQECYACRNKEAVPWCQSVFIRALLFTQQRATFAKGTSALSSCTFQLNKA